MAIAIALALCALAGPVFARSFASAKRLGLELLADHRVEFYCGCAFTDGGTILPDTCGYVPARETSRATRIEWEHIVPASRLGAGRKCWTDPVAVCGGGSGRACCAVADPDYARAEADLLNLRPAIGELNASRSDTPYGLVYGEPRRWGACDFEVAEGKAEPAESIRGDVARATLYMDRTYGIDLTDAEWWMMIEWASADPPDAWETEWRRRVIENE